MSRCIPCPGRRRNRPTGPVPPPTTGTTGTPSAAPPRLVRAEVTRFFTGLARRLPDARVTAQAVGAGVLLAASLPPWGFWPLAFVGVALLDALLAERRARSRAARMGAVVFVLLAVTLFWMKDLTVPGYVIAVIVFSAMFALAAVAIPPGRSRHIALPAMWVAAEMAKARWPFGGVPISELAIGQAGGPLLPLARIGGVPLIGLVTVAVGAVGASLVARHWRYAAGMTALVVVALVGAAVAPRGSDTGETVRVAIVQGGGEQGTHAVYSDMDEVFRVHLDAARTVKTPVDVMLWPEDVIDLDEGDIADPDNDKGRQLSALAVEKDTTIIAGVVQDVDDDHFRNYSVVVHPDGTFGGRYDKVHRVPFGEYVPLRGLVAPFAGPLLPSRDAIPGTGPAVVQTDHGPIGVVISWEVFFADRARDAIRSGGEILTNPTNGSSYTLTLVQTQQVASSRLRAVETGRWVLQAAPTGFSAVIDPSGRVTQRTSISTPEVLRAVVPRRTGNTPYLAYGDLPAPLVLASLMLIAGTIEQRRRVKHVPVLDRGVS